jgi:hypothetical protein
MRTQDFASFIMEREHVRKGKEGRPPRPKPWTTDPILQSYRFCNVRREDDKVTRWIADNWRKPIGEVGNPDLWFWMLVARLINHPDTLQFIHYKLRMTKKQMWDEERFIAAMHERHATGEKVWGGAYIVSTNGNRMNKAEYIAKFVLTPAWEKRTAMRPRKGETLESFCEMLLTLNGVQGFIAGQVIADTKYADKTLLQATDWGTFAVSGPGSKRGLNRIFGNDKDKPWNEQAWRKALAELRDATNRTIKKHIGELDAQDIQNCLCEFDKYERVRLGEGKPRSSYPGLR